MSYYNIDDLLTEEYDTSTRIEIVPFSEPQDNPFFLSFRTDKVLKLPMWLAYDLQKRRSLTAIVPHFLHVRGLSQILTKPSTNLSQYHPFFFQLGFKILNLYSNIHDNYRSILVQVLRGLFLKRFRDALVPQADTRELKSVSMHFLESLPELERAIFRRLEADFLVYHRWKLKAQETDHSIPGLTNKRQKH
jgi:hypothetical protein